MPTMIGFNKKINNISFDIESNQIGWQYKKESISIKLSGKIEFVYFLDHRNKIMILTNYSESDGKNLFVYCFDGQLHLHPEMPVLSKPVNGVYDVWFKPNSDIQTTVLLTDHFNPYDTKCNFNINTGEFSEFTRTK